MSREKVLFIGSHPDDIDLGCAISLRDHYFRGDDITTVVLTQGEKGGKHYNRVAEQNKSFKLLAPTSQNIFLNFPDTQLASHVHEIIAQIKKTILNDLPNVVYIPTSQDFHQDHNVTHNASLAALNTIMVHKILNYETPSTMPSFRPNFFKLCREEDFQIKIRALRCHESQFDKPYFNSEVIYSVAKMRATQAKFHGGLAEAYEILRVSEFNLGR